MKADAQKDKQAWLISLRILGASQKSRVQLGKKLAEKGFEREVVARTLERLERAGYLNDQLFAKHLLSRFREEKPLGRRRITYEIKKRGIPAEVCNEVLRDLGGEEEEALAVQIARDRWMKLSRLPLRNRKKRVADFLLRRGFEYHIVREVMESLESQAAGEDES